MYSSTQNLQDKRGRVASHATKLHPAKGSLESVGTIAGAEAALSEEAREKRLQELRDERERLVQQKIRIHPMPYSRGKAQRLIELEAKLSKVNAAIRAHSPPLEGFGRCLLRAMDELLEPDIRRKVFDRAKEIKRDTGVRY